MSANDPFRTLGVEGEFLGKLTGERWIAPCGEIIIEADNPGGGAVAVMTQRRHSSEVGVPRNGRSAPCGEPQHGAPGKLFCRIVPGREVLQGVYCSTEKGPSGV